MEAIRNCGHNKYNNTSNYHHHESHSLNIYYVSHMCNVCSVICYLIWLLRLDCPGLSSWSSGLLYLHYPWGAHMSVICHRLSTSPDLTSFPNSKFVCPLPVLGYLIDITNSTCPKLTPDLSEKAVLPSAFPRRWQLQPSSRSGQSAWSHLNSTLSLISHI